MVKKITISVPDELHEKMMDCKKVFNFSRVFQDAISNLIERREDFQTRLKEDKKMPEIIDRLRREQVESQDKFFQDGKIEGLMWAKSAHFEEISYALNWDIHKKPVDDNLLDYFREYFLESDEHPFFNYETDPYGTEWVNSSMFAFLQGWREGVVEFWDEIGDKL